MAVLEQLELTKLADVVLPILVDELDQPQVLYNSHVHKKTVQHFLIGLEVVVVYLHHQQTNRQLQLYLKLLPRFLLLLEHQQVALDHYHRLEFLAFNQLDVIAQVLNYVLQLLGNEVLSQQSGKKQVYLRKSGLARKYEHYL